MATWAGFEPAFAAPLRCRTFVAPGGYQAINLLRIYAS